MGELFSDTEGNLDMQEKSEKTIDRVLETYHLGRKLRALRLRKKIALTDLARHTGLSASMLSQLENGKLIPTLPTLARIAMVFDVGMEHFFGAVREKRQFAIARRSERMRFPERADHPTPSYFFECLAFATHGKLFEAYVAEFPPVRVRDVVPHQHEGAELIYLIENSVTIHFDGDDYILSAGDSAYFDSSEPHSYRNAGPDIARALVITCPPRG